MMTVWNENNLTVAARQLAAQTALLLPQAEDFAPSPTFQTKMSALLRRVKRQQRNRIAWNRVAAAVLALVLALGAVLTVSPQAQAAAERWFIKITDAVTLYWFAPTAEEGAAWDGLPQWTPSGYELRYDLQGQNGVRTLRYTSPHGDILLERFAIGGTEEYAVEIRSRATDGLSDAVTGQRPQGEAGTPKEYSITEVQVGVHHAQRYDFHTAAAIKDSSGDFGIRCYLDGELFHHVAVPHGAAALVWVDEAAQEIFLLIGDNADELQRMAESIY